MIGQKFNKLTVIKKVQSKQYLHGCKYKTYSFYLCQCDCGVIKEIRSSDIKSGNTKSCGCWKKIVNRIAPLKHGHNRGFGRRSATYRSWSAMIYRCNNPKASNYQYYGGRGITVCARWQGEHGFENFLSDMGEKRNGQTLDRIDNNGNYEPDNCKWSDHSEQCNNQRSNIKIVYNGRNYNMASLSRELNIPYPRFKYLYRYKKLTIRDILEAKQND